MLEWFPLALESLHGTRKLPASFSGGGGLAAVLRRRGLFGKGEWIYANIRLINQFLQIAWIFQEFLNDNVLLQIFRGDGAAVDVRAAWWHVSSCMLETRVKSYQRVRCKCCHIGHACYQIVCRVHEHQVFDYSEVNWGVVIKIINYIARKVIHIDRLLVAYQILLIEWYDILQILAAGDHFFVQQILFGFGWPEKRELHATHFLNHGRG